MEDGCVKAAFQAELAQEEQISGEHDLSLDKVANHGNVTRDILSIGDRPKTVVHPRAKLDELFARLTTQATKREGLDDN